MENKIYAARQLLNKKYNRSICFTNEVLNETKQVQSRMYLPSADGDYILSTGYCYFGSEKTEISKKAKEAMIDAIMNYDPNLIKKINYL